jgi:hypothetical protein
MLSEGKIRLTDIGGTALADVPNFSGIITLNILGHPYKKENSLSPLLCCP